MNQTPDNEVIRSGAALLKSFLLVFASFLCVVLIVGSFHYYYQSRSLRAISSTHENTSVKLGKSSIESRIGNVSADLLFLAHNARNLGLFDSSSPDLRQQLEQQFLTLIRQHSEYDQIRYLDQSGKEIVRVNYNNGRPHAVPDNRLQDKHARYYFRQTRELDKGDIYLSPMDLNIEQGIIESPQKPVMRFGTPVFDGKGVKTGILLINYLGKTMLDNFRDTTVNVADHIELVDSRGYWLSHPDRNREWGFMYSRKQTFGEEMPEAWDKIRNQTEGQFQSSDGLFSFSTIDLRSSALKNHDSPGPGAMHQWKIITRLAPEKLSAVPIFLGFLPIYGFSILMLGIASYLMARTRVRHHQARTEKDEITERLRLEAHFQQVFEATPNAMIMTDHLGTIIRVNGEAENCFGYQREQLIGQPVEMLLPDQFRNSHPDLVQSYLKAPTTRTLGQGRNLYGKHQNGTILSLEIGLSPVETEAGLFVLCAFIDTSERDRLTAELENSTREIAKAETLATVGRMANMVAHDLRNPLSSVKMSLQILGKKSVSEWGAEEHELRSIAFEQVRYMERIMQDLLSYSRELTLNAEWIELDKLIDVVVLLTQKEINEKNIQTDIVHQPGLPTLHGDPDKLRQVFSNLILNAINATNSDGDRTEISITTHLVLGEHHQSIRVEIADQGHGISSGIADKIFEPFFTTRSKGTGLGLAIVRKIVEVHGGDIHFDQIDEPGARAVVTLPTILPGDSHEGPAVDNPGR